MKESDFPPGWDEARVRRLLEHYKEQTEDEAVAEDESAWRDSQTVVNLPPKLFPQVRELIAKHRGL